MWRHALVGRLGVFTAILVLASGCGDGQISDAPPGARFDSDTGDGAVDDPANDPPTNDPPANDPPSDDPPVDDPPATGSDWWGSVAKPDETNTGPNCAAAGCPNATLETGNAPPSPITQNGAVYENFTMSGTLVVDADNVTLRNFSLTGSGVMADERGM